MIKKSELHQMTVQQLNDELESLFRERFSLGLQNKVGQLTHTHQIKRVRRSIAAIKTIMHAKSKESADV